MSLTPQTQTPFTPSGVDPLFLLSNDQLVEMAMRAGIEEREAAMRELQNRQAQADMLGVDLADINPGVFLPSAVAAQVPLSNEELAKQAMAPGATQQDPAAQELMQRMQDAQMLGVPLSSMGPAVAVGGATGTPLTPPLAQAEMTQQAAEDAATATPSDDIPDRGARDALVRGFMDQLLVPPSPTPPSAPPGFDITPESLAAIFATPEPTPSLLERRREELLPPPWRRGDPLAEIEPPLDTLMPEMALEAPAELAGLFTAPGETLQTPVSNLSEDEKSTLKAALTDAGADPMRIRETMDSGMSVGSILLTLLGAGAAGALLGEIGGAGAQQGLLGGLGVGAQALGATEMLRREEAKEQEATRVELEQEMAKAEADAAERARKAALEQNKLTLQLMNFFANQERIDLERARQLMQGWEAGTLDPLKDPEAASAIGRALGVDPSILREPDGPTKLTPSQEIARENLAMRAEQMAANMDVIGRVEDAERLRENAKRIRANERTLSSLEEFDIGSKYTVLLNEQQRIKEGQATLPIQERLALFQELAPYLVEAPGITLDEDGLVKFAKDLKLYEKNYREIVEQTIAQATGGVPGPLGGQ